MVVVLPAPFNPQKPVYSRGGYLMTGQLTAIKLPKRFVKPDASIANDAPIFTFSYHCLLYFFIVFWL